MTDCPPTQPTLMPGYAPHRWFPRMPWERPTIPIAVPVPVGPDGKPIFPNSVSRGRRALFAFLVTLVSMMLVTVLAFVRTPVTPEIVMTAQHVLADIGTFIGLAYIGGSVIDYSRMFGAIGGRFGINLPDFVKLPPAAATTEGS